MPGAQDVDRHDLLRAPGAVTGDRGQVHDRRAASRRALDGGQVQDVRPGGKVEPGDLVSLPVQEGRHRDADAAEVPGPQNAHHIIIIPNGRWYLPQGTGLAVSAVGRPDPTAAVRRA